MDIRKLPMIVQARVWFKEQQIPDACRVVVVILDEHPNVNCPEVEELQRQLGKKDYPDVRWVTDEAHSYRAQRERVQGIRAFIERGILTIYRTYSLFTLRELIHLDCALPEGSVWWVRYVEQPDGTWTTVQGPGWQAVGLPNVDDEQAQAQRMFAAWGLCEPE